MNRITTPVDQPPTLPYSSLPRPVQKILEKRYSMARKRKFKGRTEISGEESQAFRDNFLKQHGLLPG